MRIQYAGQDSLAELLRYDRHIARDELANSITLKRVLVMTQDDRMLGWLRFNLFWDNLPFLNMLYFLEENRGRGYGGQLLRFWEREMGKSGFRQVLTSTMSNEQGQFFFRKNGYRDCGALLLPDEPMEIIMRKDIL